MRRLLTDARTLHAAAVLLCDAVLQPKEQERMQSVAVTVLKKWAIASMV